MQVDTAPHGRRRTSVRPWVACLAVGVIVAVLIADQPSHHVSREPANRARCAANLEQIGRAIRAYAQAHGGRYPATLGGLLADGGVDRRTFVCPSSGAEASDAPTPAGVAADVNAGPAGAHCSYVYLGRGLTTATATARRAVAYEPPGNHDGDGGHVLYADGHVQWASAVDLGRLATTTPADDHDADR